MLSATTEHALRALVELAREPARAIVGRDLAPRACIPGDYLAKILGVLVGAGIVSAVRGTRGGYRLSVPAEAIRLVDVVALFEPAQARPPCLLDCARPCRDDAPCTAHPTWSAVRARILGFLESTTIAMVTPHGPAPALPRYPNGTDADDARRAAPVGPRKVMKP